MTRTKRYDARIDVPVSAALKANIERLADERGLEPTQLARIALAEYAAKAEHKDIAERITMDAGEER